MELEEIQRKVEAGQYAVRPHAVIHAVKEGFTEADMVSPCSTERLLKNTQKETGA
jgi:hypothetical protein